MNPHFLLQDEAQIKTVESIKRVDKDGYLYYMDNYFDYYHIGQPFASMLGGGCSTMVAKNTDGEYLMYRNYDYDHKLNNDKKNPVTGINVVVNNHNPNAKYRSIGVGDAYWLDFKNGTYVNGLADDGKSDVSAFVMMPYLCMDGMNEMGLSVSIMALVVKCDWKEIDYDTYKEKLNPDKTNYQLEKAGEVPDIWARKNDIGSVAYNDIDKKAWICEKELFRTTMPNKQGPILHPVLMRMMLDNCANVTEAIGLADSFNLVGPASGMDFHIMVADQSGACKVLEWVDNKMNVIDTCHSTNYRFSADDRFHGHCDRDDALKAGLERGKKCGLREDYGLLAMRLAVQDPTFAEEGKTQYTSIYNLAKKTLKVYSFADFTKSYEYTL